jgi:hypothetical protein
VDEATLAQWLAPYGKVASRTVESPRQPS